MKKSIIIVLGIVLVLIIGAYMGGFYAVSPSNSVVSCTKEAKVCPDGSVVGRIPPRCDFAPCPGKTTEN